MPPARSTTPPTPSPRSSKTVTKQAELFRQYQGFADAVKTDPQAPAFDRALALSGRDPASGKP